MPKTKESGTSFEQQHEKNMRILKLIREEPAWALSRILLAEELEAERDVLREAVEWWINGGFIFDDRDLPLTADDLVSEYKDSQRA